MRQQISNGKKKIEWKWTEKEVVPEYYESAMAPMKKLVNPNARILEIGVGCGYVLSRMTKQSGGYSVGIDEDKGAIGLSYRVASSEGVRLHLVQGCCKKLPFKDETFDLVFSQGLIEHFPKNITERMIGEHVRVLRKGGVLAVSVPNIYNIFHSWLKWRQGSSYRYYPERSYRPSDLSRLMERHGIVVAGRDGYGMFWSLWHQSSRLAYYTSAITIRCGLDQQFEKQLPAWMRSQICMMTLAWGHRRS